MIKGKRRIFNLLVMVVLSVIRASATTHYVDPNNPAPTSPYTTWSSAATTIQDAIDAANPADVILVTNGVYQTGAREVFGTSNRVAVTIPVTVRSMNGPAVTQIVGYKVPGTTNGPAAVRCAFLTNGAVLAGFTLTNGATQNSGYGGGVWCWSASAIVSNCTIVGNASSTSGGGVYSGTLNDCTLAGNSASSAGGVYSGALNNCILAGNSASDGGGAVFCSLTNCTLTNNSAATYGGAAEYGTLNNCVLARNSAQYAGAVYDGNLINCTLTNNSASVGGGVDGGTLTNCILAGNSGGGGGAADEATLYNCILTGNSAKSGGGANQAKLINCVLTGNSANYGGGAYVCKLTNCIVYFNSAQISGANYFDSSFDHGCTTPLPAGPGNLADDPQLADASHLSAGSPCIGQGNLAAVRGVDIDGEPWANPPSIGCDEYSSGSITGAPTAAIAATYTNVAVGFQVDLLAEMGGRVSASHWDFGDGNVLSNHPFASHAWTAIGDYLVELRAYNETYPAGVMATVIVHVAGEEHFVSLASVNPVTPYGTWTTAATNIQDAVDSATLPGAVVWVSNGVYQAGMRDVYGMSNRVAVTKPITVRSVNGPNVTRIEGNQLPGVTNGPGTVRCVYLTNAAALSGFTLTKGATRTDGDVSKDDSGGGVWCEGASAVVSNCNLTSNSARGSGGGAYLGTLINCTLIRNSGFGFGTTAGGAFGCVLNNCTLINNVAGSGGGVDTATLNNCTLAGNSASSGGGALNSTLNNCILYYNTATSSGTNYSGGTLNYCCTIPLPAGLNNLTNAPLFVNTNGWSDLHLLPNSPCINSGNNAMVVSGPDLDGRPRIVDGTVDMGAHEFQGTSLAGFLGWLQSFGFPTDISSDTNDFDHDGLNNWQEWRAGTNPTNSASVLQVLSVTATNNPLGVMVTWQSAAGIVYYVQRSIQLGVQPAFLTIGSNIAGQAGTTGFTDTNAASASSLFYRVGVQP
jgi:hypothetical protein